MTTGKSDLVTINAFLKAETEKAILIENIKKENVWIPKSQCEFEVSNDGKSFDIEMPEWLAMDKGLI